MSGHRISEAAQATGFTVSALRFYEKEGIVVPGRTETGYRSYQDEDLDALRFVSRAKTLGLTLPEITELLALLKQDDCGPVQSRLRQLVHERIGEAQAQIADLVALTAQLQQVVSRLGAHTPHGACDDECGCRTEPSGTSRSVSAVPLLADASTEVACSLEPDRVEQRTEDWEAMVSHAADRQPLEGGIRLRFPRQFDVAALSRLAAEEQTCCGFVTFMIGIHADAVTLDVTGPADAQPVIAAMFGVAA